MKIALTVLVALTLLGCSGERADSLLTAPSPLVGTGSLSPTGGSLAMLFGMVVNESGGCIVGATVEVVRGQGLGQSITQTTPCDAWGYSGGFIFSNLTPGVEMTLRAAASGYASPEMTVVPSTGPQTAVLFSPSRIQ